MIDQKRLEMRDLALDRLYRLRGMLGAVIFLMGGEDHSLDHPYEEFETWLGDIQDRVGETIDIITAMPVSTCS